MESNAFEIIENTPDLIWSIDRSLHLTAFNSAFREAQGKMIGRDPRPGDFVLYDVYPSEFLADWRKKYEIALAGERVAWEQAYTFEDGPHYYEITLNPIRRADGSIAGVCGNNRDITRRRKIEDQVNTLYQAVQKSPLSVIITNPDGHFIYVNPAFEEMTGFRSADILGLTPRILKSGLTPDAVYRDLWDTVRSGRIWRGELLNRRKGGNFFWETVTITPIYEAGETITGFIAYMDDISIQKQQEERLFYQAHFDELTGLPNRALGMDRLANSLEPGGRRVLLIFIDLDNFKKINDSVGHQVGDALLRDVVERLRVFLRENDTLARFSGDKFFMIREDLKDLEEAERIALELSRGVFAESFFVAGREFDLTASLGLSLAPDDGTDSHLLLRNAETAMYRAKKIGRNTVQFFMPQMNTELEKKLRMEFLLRRAVERNEFFLVYQPIVSLTTGRIRSVEALLRWENPELGRVAPLDFIGLAEETGVIQAVGRWVLGQACAAALAWQGAGLREFRVAVNISPRQFAEGHLPEVIGEILRAAGLPPTMLEIEVTEGLFLHDYGDAREALDRLRATGIQIAMDDFGTGYSSLRYLRDFPFQTLKIDGSFIRDILTNPGDLTLVSSILAMARQLGLVSVAEGVETCDQLDILRERGCDMVQGYCIARPLTFDEMVARLASAEPWLPAPGTQDS